MDIEIGLSSIPKDTDSPRNDDDSIAHLSSKELISKSQSRLSSQSLSYFPRGSHVRPGYTRIREIRMQLPQ